MATKALLSIALGCAAALALSACSTPDNLRGAPATVVPGSASDPASPAYFRANVGDRVLFPVDQSTLTPEARGTLDAQARWLAQNRSYVATIEGHADEQGTREYNLALGARRAAAAKEYLIAIGVDPTRLRTVSFGKERPLEVCSTEVCYAQNRRAVTVVALGSGV